MKIGDKVKNSPVGPGKITGFTKSGYAQVNHIAVAWLDLDDPPCDKPKKEPTPKELVYVKINDSWEAIYRNGQLLYDGQAFYNTSAIMEALELQHRRIYIKSGAPCRSCGSYHVPKTLDECLRLYKVTT